MNNYKITAVLDVSAVSKEAAINTVIRLIDAQDSSDWLKVEAEDDVSDNADNARPDRIWTDGCAEHSWFPDDGTEIYQADTLYIRRDAFPMEEIAQACHSSWLSEDLEDLLSRILSLLEDSE